MLLVGILMLDFKCLILANWTPFVTPDGVVARLASMTLSGNQKRRARKEVRPHSQVRSDWLRTQPLQEIKKRGLAEQGSGSPEDSDSRTSFHFLASTLMAEDRYPFFSKDDTEIRTTCLSTYGKCYRANRFQEHKLKSPPDLHSR